MIDTELEGELVHALGLSSNVRQSGLDKARDRSWEHLLGLSGRWQRRQDLGHYLLPPMVCTSGELGPKQSQDSNPSIPGDDLPAVPDACFVKR